MELTTGELAELITNRPTDPKSGHTYIASHPSRLLGELVGRNVVVRSVTFHYIGRLADYDGTNLLLEDASWLADSGRFGEMLDLGSYAEVEKFPDPVIVSWGAGVDITTWWHDLPTRSK